MQRSRPLEGCVVCCTGLEREDKARVRDDVEGLGARYEIALTVNTTHVVCTSTTTPKYRVAVHHGCFVVTPEWVSACAATRSRVAEALHAVKPLSGCVVCPTGLPTDEREELEALTASLGGRFMVDLMRDATHLVAAAACGRKHDYAVRWKLHVVSADWLRECARQEMRLPEANFPAPLQPPLPPPPPQKLEAVAPSEALLGLSTLPPHRGCLEGSSVALVGFGSGEEEARSEISAMGAAVDSLDSERLTHAVLASSEHGREALARISVPGVAVVLRGWLDACVESRSHVPESDFLLPPEKLQPPKPAAVVKKERVAAALAAVQGTTMVVEDEDELVPTKVPVKTLLQGLVFTSVGCTVRQEHRFEMFVGALGGAYRPLQSHERVDYVIAPHGWRGNVSEVIDGVAMLVAPQWLELSAKLGQLLSLDESPIFSPLPHKLPIEQMRTVKASTTGFTSRQWKILKQLLSDIGSRPTKNFSRTLNTHLICASTEGLKFLKAREWGTPAVTVSWLHSCVRAGRLLPTSKYEARPSSVVPSDGFPLRGVVLFVAAKSISGERTQELIDAVSRLGGEGEWSYNRRVTHIIAEGSERSAYWQRIAQQAPGTHVVSQQWVVRCAETHSHLREADFPAAAANAIGSLDLTADSPPPPKHPPAPMQGMSPFLQHQQSLHSRTASGARGGSRRSRNRGARGDPPMTAPECKAFFDRHDRLAAGNPIDAAPFTMRATTAPGPQAFLQRRQDSASTTTTTAAAHHRLLDESHHQQQHQEMRASSAPAPDTTEQPMAETLNALVTVLEKWSKTGTAPQPAAKRPRRTSSDKRRDSTDPAATTAAAEDVPPDENSSQGIALHADDDEDKARQAIRQKLATDAV